MYNLTITELAQNDLDEIVKYMLKQSVRKRRFSKIPLSSDFR